MYPIISIIIPTFNRAHIISETLDSIMTQTYKNWECIVVDDGSTDNIDYVLNKYIQLDLRFSYYKRPEYLKKGANSCRNYGFSKSKGSWIKWFDSDDLLNSNAFNIFYENQDSNIDVIVSKLQKINLANNQIIGENNIFSKKLIDDYLIGNIAFFVSGPTWKKYFLEKQTELFDENITNLDDWDFNLRMLYQNPKIVYIDEPLIKYRVYDSSLSSEIGKLNIFEIKSEFNAREKHVKILDEINQPAKLVLIEFIKKRSKFFLRESLVKNLDSQFYFLKQLLFYQIKTFDLFGFFKTVFAVLFFKIFNKGYKFLN